MVKNWSCFCGFVPGLLDIFRLSVPFCVEKAQTYSDIFILNAIPFLYNDNKPIYLCSTFPVFQLHVIELLHLLLDLQIWHKTKTEKKKKIKSINHLTLFFNICRFVLLFPTFLQQKGLSNSLRIRRACWLKTKESPCFANPDREELKPVTALPLLRFFAFRVMRRACTVWNR